MVPYPAFLTTGMRGIFISEHAGIFGFCFSLGWRGSHFFKKRRELVPRAKELTAPHQIQPREYSKGGGPDGMWYKASRFSTSTATTTGGTATSTGSTMATDGMPRTVSCSATASFLFRSTRRSFLFEIRFPSYEHFAGLYKRGRKLRVLFVGKHFDFPGNEQKEFH